MSNENPANTAAEQTISPKKPRIRMLFVITSPKLAKKTEQLFAEGHIPFQYRSYGQGTASSEMMDLLGLSGTDKIIMISMLPKIFADEMLKKLRRQLRLGLVDTGVAFTIPVSGVNSRTMKLMEGMESAGNTEDNRTTGANSVTGAAAFTGAVAETNSITEGRKTEMTESTYSLIMAMVDRGYSESVMEAARPQGATGGTVINSRRVGSEEAMHFWGITVQPERELVMILAEKSCKKEIMKAVGEKCGMRSEAHGIVMSLPVDGVAGLE